MQYMKEFLRLVFIFDNFIIRLYCNLKLLSVYALIVPFPAEKRAKKMYNIRFCINQGLTCLHGEN